MSTDAIKPINSSSVFGTSMAYESCANTIKAQLFKKTLDQVKEWDMTQPRWKLTKLSKTLANAAFEEFRKKMQAIFINPNYEFWLTSSLNAEKQVFIPELLKQINSKMPSEIN